MLLRRPHRLSRKNPDSLDVARQTVRSDAWSRLGLSELWAYMRADV
jgi:hypothetical protein